MQAGQLTGSYGNAPTLAAQQLSQQTAQQGLANQLAMAQLLNSPTSTLMSGSASTYGADFIAQLYKALGINVPPKNIATSGTSSIGTNNPVTSTSGGTGVGGTGDTTDNSGTLVFGQGRGAGSNIVAAPANTLQPVGPAQPENAGMVGQMGMTPEQLAQLQRLLGLNG